MTQAYRDTMTLLELPAECNHFEASEILTITGHPDRELLQLFNGGNDSFNIAMKGLTEPSKSLAGPGESA